MASIKISCIKHLDIDMTKKTIFMCVLTIIMIAYMCYAIPLTWTIAADARMQEGVSIHLSDPSSKFVNSSDVLDVLNIEGKALSQNYIKDFDLNELEKRLKATDKFQDANVTLTSNGNLMVDVSPMEPVARVFDSSRPSYYINATGKRISADLRYHIDVPVIVGTFSDEHPPHDLLPLLNYIAADPKLDALVATVTQEADGNIIIVPNIVGHVINFGDTTLMTDKFNRLRIFYREVAPSKGWMTYDTIAVKWRDRIVATRRHIEEKKIVTPTDDDMSGALDLNNNEPSPEEISPEIIEDQKRTLP